MATWTVDGELALELGDPPLVLMSSDAVLLSELELELEYMRYCTQLRRMTDAQRSRQAQLYTAGAYLADALRQLATGLRVVQPEEAAPVQCVSAHEVLRGQASTGTPRFGPSLTRSLATVGVHRARAVLPARRT